MATAATPTNSHEFPFSREGFASAWGDVRSLLMEEWPQLDQARLDATEADPDKVVDLVTKSTDHSKALVRKQLGEIAEAAGVGAKGIEQRLVRLLHKLEQASEPVVTGAQKTVQQLGERGQVIVDNAQQVAGRAEEKVKEHPWTALLAALGVGLLLGLLVGLTRGR